MRDPNRIYKFQNLVTTLWSMYPDMRYTQIMAMIQIKVAQMKNLPFGADVFNVEDDVVEAAVQSMINGENII